MSRKNILVIEDESNEMQFVHSALERNGFDVAEANDGARALELLRENDYWAVISDMRTPGDVNGADVHAWLVQNRPQLARRMLFITGDTANEETMAILRQTQVPCIEKPFRIRELLAKIDEVFGAQENP